MLMVYLKLDHAIRPMQKRGERLFEFGRESYRVNQKNAADRLLHAFPAMIAARWADANDYLSNRRADWDEMDAIIAYQAIRIVPVDTNGMRWYHGIPIFPPFFPLFPPTTPITSYNPPNSPLKQINCLRPPRQNGATTVTTENDN